MRVCSRGFDNSMYVDLYDGDDNLVMKLVEAGLAVKSSVPPYAVRFHQSFDSDAASVPSDTEDEPVYVLVPG